MYLGKYVLCFLTTINNLLRSSSFSTLSYLESVNIVVMFCISCFKIPVSYPIKQFVRGFAVKELPWCKPSSKISNDRNALDGKEANSEDKHTIECIPCSISENSDSFKFGVIAAMDESRIIGVNGDLPWDILEDRLYFEDITRDKILILGKNSFMERDDFSHLEHLDKAIVISTSLQDEDCASIRDKVVIARSFEEAVDMANSFQSLKSDGDKEEERELDVWIGGGQLIYEKSLRHPCAHEIHLTTVHTKSEVDLSKERVSFFPTKYRWDNTFKEVLSLRRESKDLESGLTYTFSVHKRLQR